jgi:ATP-dependent Clp protease ATP-binding subunit ClpC
LPATRQKAVRDVGLGAVFERFTERARQVVVLAQDEARALNHNYIGTEHILLGLLREEEGVAARVLESLDVTVEEVRAQIERVVGRGDEITAGQIPFTPRAKKVLELALREALSLNHSYIGPEHILLGVARENKGVAARILLNFGADAEAIRERTIALLGGPAPRSVPLSQPEGRAAGWTSYGPLARRTPSLLLGWALGTFSLGVGILIGWAIWGQ